MSRNDELKFPQSLLWYWVRSWPVISSVIFGLVLTIIWVSVVSTHERRIQALEDFRVVALQTQSRLEQKETDTNETVHEILKRIR